MGNSLEVPIYSHEDIREHSKNFLDKYHPSLKIPIPIEEIIEFQMDINITPLPGLHKVIEVDGFTSSNLSCISVDEFVHSSRLNRYRFTLAHEVAHITLHKDIYSSATFRNLNEWKEFINSIPINKHRWLEYHAYTFAGLVLVPSQDLKHLTAKHVDRIKEEGISLKKTWDFAWDCIAAQLGKDFEVSSQVIERRLIKEEIKEEYT